MSCEQAAELLPALALDALEGPERELLEAHLRRCPACAGELRALGIDPGRIPPTSL